ncbi:MAG: SpoIID/LytB domain-containing protein [Gemmatimonadaceae bacterium]
MTWRRLAAAAALVVIGACVTTRLGVPVEEPIRVVDQPPAIAVEPTPAAPVARPEEMPRDEAPDFRREGDRDVRVALATAVETPGIAGMGAWRLFDDRESVLVRGRPGEGWTLEQIDGQLRAVRTDGFATAWRPAPLVMRADRVEDFLLFGGKRYRGVLRFHVADDGVRIMVVSVLGVEQYLRGVVPLEIGGRTAAEAAAVQAQAVAARSYTYVRLAAAGGRAGRHANYDLMAGTSDQVYGGVDAERAFSDAAVVRTAGLVLKYGGRTVDAPYSAACGGETASADEVWRTGAQAYLRRVSDRIPGTERYYCDPAPRFAWTRTLESADLDAALRQYLRNYASVPSAGPGHATGVTIDARTPSGRVAVLRIATESGPYMLRGNEVRYVLRPPGGEILNSTYFSLERENGPGGALRRLVIRGNGWGHGIGMCQWGAIGRARAGQDFRTILRTYYPGTDLGPAS